jgi:hypothetical protein
MTVQFQTRNDIAYPIVAFFVTPERITMEDAYRILLRPSLGPSPAPALRVVGENRFVISYRITGDDINERYREAYTRMRSMLATAEPGATVTVAGQVRAPVPDITQWQPPGWFPAAARMAIVQGTLSNGAHRFAMPDSEETQGGDVVVWVNRTDGRAEYQYYQYFPEQLAYYLRMTRQNQRQASLLLNTFTDFNSRMELLVEQGQQSPDSARQIIHNQDIQALRFVVAISVQMLSTGMTFAAINASAPRVIQVAQLRGAQQRRGITSAARPSPQAQAGQRPGTPPRTGSTGQTRAGGSQPRPQPAPPSGASTTVTPVMNTATIASQAQIIVGTVVQTVRQGEAILAQLAANNRNALRALGIGRLPRTFNPANVEWGLGVYPGTGGRPPRLYIVRGGANSVAWQQFPGMVSLSHSHPPPGTIGLPRLVNATGTPPSLNILDLIHLARTRLTNAELHNISVIFPSGSDYRYVALNRIRNHRVFTSLRYLGNYRVAVASPATRGAPPVVIRIEYARMLSQQVAASTTEAHITMTAGNTTLWRGRVQGRTLAGVLDTTVIPPAYP